MDWLPIPVVISNPHSPDFFFFFPYALFLLLWFNVSQANVSTQLVLPLTTKLVFVAFEFLVNCQKIGNLRLHAIYVVCILS